MGESGAVLPTEKMDYAKPDSIISQLEAKPDSLDKARMGLATGNTVYMMKINSINIDDDNGVLTYESSILEVQTSSVVCFLFLSLLCSWKIQRQSYNVFIRCHTHKDPTQYWNVSSPNCFSRTMRNIYTSLSYIFKLLCEFMFVSQRNSTLTT